MQGTLSVVKKYKYSILNISLYENNDLRKGLEPNWKDSFNM